MNIELKIGKVKRLNNIGGISMLGISQNVCGLSSYGSLTLYIFLVKDPLVFYHKINRLKF